MGAAGPVLGGNGRVNGDGTIDRTVSFRFPPSSTRLTTSWYNMTAVSRLLWDADTALIRAAPISGGN